MLHMLDTDIASYIIKDKDPLIREKLRFLLPSSLCVSAVTRAELLYGLKRLPAEHHLHVGVAQFMKVVRVLPWGADAAEFYAEIRQQLTVSGKLIGELDMLIAAHALSAPAILVTNNMRHYERIRLPLVMENWTTTELR